MSPFAFAIRFIHEHACHGITVEDVLQGVPLSRMTLERRFRKYLGRSPHAEIRAVAAEPSVADLLQVPPGFPLLSVERVSYTYGDRPVEVRRGWYVTTGYYYQNDLS